jgi:hypothetical protein
MRTTSALSAIAALTVGSAVMADSQFVNVGTFWNTPPAGNIGYNGEFGSFISTQTVIFDYTHTVISIDLTGLLQSIGANALVSVTVTDTGANSNGPLSPGADIDFFKLVGAPEGISTSLAYLGPNNVHINEGGESLANRVDAVDAFSGAQDVWNMTHVSLGTAGSLKATFSGGQSSGSDSNVLMYGGSSGSGLVAPVKLLLSEAGFSESFKIGIEVTSLDVPCPAAFAPLLGLATIGRRRRRS